MLQKLTNPVSETPRIHKIIDTIVELYGGKKIELDYETPFQLLVAVILSAQTTDKQVNKITPPFFAKIRETKDMENMEIEEIEGYFKYINYFRNKSKYIKATASILTTQYNGIIPNTLEEMQSLPGVGIKTAKVVLSVLYDLPYVGVDTHIHRVMNRLDVVHTTTPNETDKILDSILTIESKKKIHHPCVLFGRYTCKAKNPLCNTCFLQDMCNFYKENFRNKKISL